MNNNEQDLILNEKIRKRERFDTILAYVLLGVLVVSIGLVIILKVLERDEPEIDEYVPTYISVEDISNYLNNSTLVNKYINDGAGFMASPLDGKLQVNYVKDDVNLNLEFDLVSSELVIQMPNENSDVVEEIYMEIANIICMYYGNEEKLCRNTLDINDINDIDSIRVAENGDSNTIYINTTRSYTVNDKVVYTDVTTFDINDSDYVLHMNNIKVYNIRVATSDVDVLVGANIMSLDNSRVDGNVNVKLYDKDGNVISEKNNSIRNGVNFEVTFEINDNLKLENISKYSIEINK